MHLRQRFLISIIKKKQKVFPLVGVLGARQVGKSTLLRDLIGKLGDIPYFTLDRPEILQELRTRAESFILANSNDFSTPIILDEAHKAPQAFDVLKVLADERKNRGIVTITGSVDFSLASGVRETLTGRIGLCRLYPLSVSEVAQRQLTTPFAARELGKRTSAAPASVKEVETWLARGGMPAICQLSNRVERELVIEDWLQSVCYRDLPQLKGARYDGALARQLLGLIAKSPHYSESEMARVLGEDTRRVKSHLRGLEALFVIYRIAPYREGGGSGFDLFCLHDAAIASYLGADRKTLYLILVVNEILTQFEYGSLGRVSLFHYSSRGRLKLSLVIKANEKLTPMAILDRDAPTSNEIKSLRAMVQNQTFQKINCLAPVSQAVEIHKGLRLIPYEHIC